MLSPSQTLAGLTAALLLAPSASAHEFWLLPSTFRCAPDSLLRVEMYHGERFNGELVARNTPQIARYELLQGDQTTEVKGLHASHTGLLRPSAPGPGIIVYESNEYINILEAPRFEAYLEEEGLTAIKAWREREGRSGEHGREAYVRCAKALVAVGDPGDAPADHPVGLAYEIVLDRAGVGDAGATVLFGGVALEGARVVVVSQTDPSDLIELTTDEHGQIQFAPAPGGAWMITSLHMVQTTDREDVDWKSYWASLTFELGDGRPRG
ncbi:MAG: DUF4198 domain-containing protein [Phycisphaerales bacterium]|nr:DUF4198 domain-containing protein [Phycisphaerales bacterium]